MSRSSLTWAAVVTVGIVVGMLFPVREIGAPGIEDPSAARTRHAPAPLLQGAGQEPDPQQRAKTDSAKTPRPIPPHLQDVGLAPPERDWRVALEDPKLDHEGRVERLLGLAERFRSWRQYDWVERTLALVHDRTREGTGLRARADLARAWNDERRGRPRTALERMESVAAETRVPRALRARAAYGAILLAYGLDELDRAGRALKHFETQATSEEAGLRRDVELRFAALIRDPKRKER